MVGLWLNGALAGPASDSLSSLVRFNSMSSLSWSLIKPFPSWKNWSKRQTKASSLVLKPATIESSRGSLRLRGRRRSLLRRTRAERHKRER